MIGVLVIVVIVGGTFGYKQFLENGLRAQSGTSSLDQESIRDLFAQKVGRLGWSIIDEDNPMVAQSPLMAGRRQQIVLELTAADGAVGWQIYPQRVWRKGFIRMPYKAHTLRIRMNSFVAAVRAADGSGYQYDDSGFAVEGNIQRPQAALAPRFGGIDPDMISISKLANRFALEQSMPTYEALSRGLLNLEPDQIPMALSDAIDVFESELRLRRSTESVFAAAQRLAIAAHEPR